MRVTVTTLNGSRITCSDPRCIRELLEAGAELLDPARDLERLARAEELRQKDRDDRT